MSRAAISAPPGIDPTLRDELLQRYVDDKGLVNYQAWKESTVDLEALDTSLSQYAPQSSDPAHGEEADAALINAYNAFTIQWILQNYPTTSIKTLKNSWTERRHTIGGHSIFPRRNRAP